MLYGTRKELNKNLNACLETKNATPAGLDERRRVGPGREMTGRPRLTPCLELIGRIGNGEHTEEGVIPHRAGAVRRIRPGIPA